MEQNKRRTTTLVFAGLVGSILEWYDFAVYVYLAPIIASLFFPHENKLVSLMFAYLIFAIGFLIRPIGAFVFGHIGDRIGRKKTLVAIIILMSLPTFLIGLLPTYASIGIAAPLLLVLLRLLQGLSAGGELIGCTAFATESVSKKYRGMVSSLIWIGSGLGILLGSGIVALTSSMTSKQIMQSWAWRIPFLLGIIAGYIGYILRRKTQESKRFVELEKKGEVVSFPMVTIWRTYKIPLIKMFLLSMLGAIGFYLVFVFMPTYSTKILHYSLHEALTINTVIMLVLLCLNVLMGYLSDKFGRKPLMLAGVMGFIAFSLPLYILIDDGALFELALGQLAFAVILSLYAGPMMATLLEMVPTQVRYSAVAVGYNVGYAIFGGTAPLVATYLIHATKITIFPAFYLMLASIIVLPVLLMMRETYHTEL